MRRDAEKFELHERIRQVATDRVDVLRGQITRSMEVLNSIASFYSALSKRHT